MVHLGWLARYWFRTLAWSAPIVIPTFAIVYFAKHLECLWVLDVGEMRTWVWSADKRVVLHVVSRSFLLDFYGLWLVLWQVLVHQVVDDGILPVRILINMYQIQLLCLFNAWLVKVLDWDETSELSIQCWSWACQCVYVRVLCSRHLLDGEGRKYLQQLLDFVKV